jgi:putative MATE family efflux protein
MLESKPYILFFKYLIPSMLGFLAISSANIIDGYFVGNYVGYVSLAAINISFPLFNILFGFALMFAVGNSVITAKLMGEGNIKEASNVFTKSIYTIVILAIILNFSLYMNIDRVLDFINVQDELRDETLKYLPVILKFLPFLMIGITVDYFVKVDENPNLSFIALVLSSLVNVILDYIFIVKFNWGISGAAYATGISEIVILIVLLPHFFLKNSTLRLVKPKGSFFNIFNALKNGFSEFINESSVGITILIFNYVLLKNFGALGIASFSIVGYFITISILTSFAVSDSLQAIISKNYGAQYFNRMKSFLRLGLISIICIEIVLTLFVIISPELLINIFIKGNEHKTKEMTIEFLSYVWPAFLFSGLNMLATAYLTSIQKPLYSGLIAIMRSLIFPITFVFTLPFIFGNVGIFMALSCAEVLTFIFAIRFFMKNRPGILSRISE